MSPLKSLAVRLLRTVVPAFWSGLIVWAANKGYLTAEVRELLEGSTNTVVLPIVLGAFYAGTAAIEGHLSKSSFGRLLLALLAGHPATPAYTEDETPAA